MATDEVTINANGPLIHQLMSPAPNSAAPSVDKKSEGQNIPKAVPVVMPLKIPSIDPDFPSSFYNAFNLAKSIILKVQVSAKEAFASLQKKIIGVSFPPIIASINSYATDIEKIINVVSCLPFFGFFFSSIRILAAKAQIVGGVSIALIAEIGLFLENRKDGDSAVRGKWQTLYKLGMEHTIHGCLNLLRGTAEALVASTTSGFGNVLLLIPNMWNKREFNPYFEYGTLVSPKEVPR